jgi:hypothetical protein
MARDKMFFPFLTPKIRRMPMDDAIEKAKQAVRTMKKRNGKVGSHILARIAMQTCLSSLQIVDIYLEV